MPEALPKYRKPPVIETVLGVQFAALGFNGAHAGWFWKTHLPEDFTKANFAGPIDDVFEAFPKKWARSTPGLQFISKADRIQIVRNDEQRMVQLQNTRFLLNWMRRDNDYPSYDVLRSEFDRYLDEFVRFVTVNELGEYQPNQWEITYVNHIPRGQLWTELAELQNVFPGFYIPAQGCEGLGIDGFATEWSLATPDSRGRLHISARHAKVKEVEGVQMTMTARGPMGELGTSLAEGLDLGRKAIVQSFTEMTSEAAHKLWERTN